MSPRPKNNRTVFDPPKFKGYRPYGFYAGQGTPIRLLFEEYTAIRLCDYELMTQAQAALAMHVSRPTFTRLYEGARRKIAEALSEAKTIEVERGHAYFDSDWFHCGRCNVFFNTPSQEFPVSFCPVCHLSTAARISEPAIEKKRKEEPGSSPTGQERERTVKMTAIAAQDASENALIDKHFGKCACFFICNEESGKVEVFENPGREHVNCSGKEVVSHLLERDVRRIIAGDFGSNVQQILNDHKIQMVIHPDSQIPVREIIRQLTKKPIKRTT